MRVLVIFTGTELPIYIKFHFYCCFSSARHYFSRENISGKWKDDIFWLKKDKQTLSLVLLIASSNSCAIENGLFLLFWGRVKNSLQKNSDNVVFRLFGSNRENVVTI